MKNASERAVARDDISVKLDAQTARKAKLVATNRGITLAEYLTSIVEPVATRDLKEEMGRMIDATPKPTRSPKSSAK
jgi:reverse gyrase